MKEIEEKIVGYKMPFYMEEILTHNYCPHFLRMSMVREKDNYRFSYSTERYKKICISILNTYEKLVLLRTIMTMNEKNSDWLIGAEYYLIDPELIYTLNNCVADGCVKMLFYPDYKKTSFEEKLIDFSEKIKNRREKKEIELLEKFQEIVVKGDMNRTKLFLDKQILRMETERKIAV